MQTTDDFHCNRLSCNIFNPPDESIGSDAISSSDPLVEGKTYHRQVAIHSQSSLTAAVDETKVFYKAYRAGTITQVQVGVTDQAVGDSTVGVDVHKNGVSILSADITLTNADTDYSEQTAGLLGGVPVAFVAGDVFEAVIDATVGTGTLPKGVHIAMVVVEKPSV